ncbi:MULTISPECIES: M20 family metallopeptidase [Rhodanobacter]|uniref:M20 family metallopeptidase n=1 Tax=Rhodanobacter TaxID=75309 RepID=UPI0003FA9274|nr:MULTISPECIES: M20 family metallopeptidase [Rhodanobacter]TAN19604.1 MAG: amidohydrolase [Rhodanobacter sp.]UJJ54902.1 M20 family metallopeptidase [Rhodanobacter thiooxydans]
MNEKSPPSAKPLPGNLHDLLPQLQALYTDIHAHPELSMQETRTAGLAADHLRAAGYEVTTGIGKTGVVGLLRNGDGPTVMLRADMDALPVQEATGAPYASKVTAVDHEGKTVPVMHACGHDMHVTWLVGATTLMAQNRDSWKGTLMAVFQPAEETAQGAQAMIDDGLFKRFPKPDVVLGQHVMVGPAGAIGGRKGVITSAADSLQIRLFGRGAHGSMPQASIDPVVMAAATVLRLQTIVARELAPTEAAVVTIGSLQAGTKENVIPDEAVIKLNVRTFDEGVRKRVLAAITRIVNAEAAASGAPKPPEITPLDNYSLVTNDDAATTTVVEAFRQYFPAERIRQTGPTSASEDFGSFGAEWGVPSVFWFVGGTDPDTYAKAKAANRLNEIPTNHNPRFLPVLHPTLETGVETLMVAARAWLAAAP